MWLQPHDRTVLHKKNDSVVLYCCVGHKHALIRNDLISGASLYRRMSSVSSLIQINDSHISSPCFISRKAYHINKVILHSTRDSILDF